LKVLDHAHDRNLALNAVIAKNGAHHSFDRWHIARSAAKEMRAISSGTQKSKGTTWHPELADKVSRMRNHLYWAMDHCNGDEATLKRHLDSAIEHFQMRHDGCDPTSVCCQPGYAPDYVVLQDPVAILLLTNFVRRSAIYRKPADYVYGRDTYLVESFNNVVLLYLDKRIHYRDLTFMRCGVIWRCSTGTNTCHVITHRFGMRVRTAAKSEAQRRRSISQSLSVM